MIPDYLQQEATFMEAPPKEFKGVLRGWYREEIGAYIRIIGFAEYHRQESLRQQMMHTSYVVKMEQVTPTLILCETKNSYYLLTGVERT